MRQIISLKNDIDNQPTGTRAKWHEDVKYINAYAPTSGVAKIFKHYWKNVKIHSFLQEHVVLADDFENVENVATDNDEKSDDGKQTDNNEILDKNNTDENNNKTDKNNNPAQKLEVVVFSHGLLGNRFMYSMICQEIASQGYLVAAIEHRDNSASLSFEIDMHGKETPVEYIKHPVAKAGEFHEESFVFRNKQVEKRTSELRYACEVIKKLNQQGMPNFYPHTICAQICDEFHNGVPRSTVEGFQNHTKDICISLSIYRLHSAGK